MPKGNLEKPINLTVMFLDCGRKPEYLERTHTCTGRTCKLHAERSPAGSRTQDLFFDKTTVLPTAPPCSLIELSSFVTSWMSFDALSYLGFLATPGMVHHCSMFSPFLDYGSHCGSWGRKDFVTLD
ncbi:hypothetical protein XENOCAPTIV_016675 [Xenoophorus captivus]|uniref:Uncharacterized protein n=1 Tax=Xenoophorus captivus TaxID=1517983 RepID=A0ABV0S0Y9_9TELE